jgi:hypothetical protein
LTLRAYDLTEIARRLAEGEDVSTIAAALDGPPGPTAEEQAATDARRQLQDARGASTPRLRLPVRSPPKIR